MPEYKIEVKSEAVLSGFALALLEARVKEFFRTEADPKAKVEAKYN